MLPPCAILLNNESLAMRGEPASPRQSAFSAVTVCHSPQQFMAAGCRCHAVAPPGGPRSDAGAAV